MLTREELILNVHRSFRPIAVFSKIIGVIALQNVFSSNRRPLKFHWLSFDTFWTLIMGSVPTGIYISWQIKNNLSLTKFYFIILALTTILQVFINLKFNVGIIPLLQKIESFDKSFSFRKHVPKSPYKNYFNWYWPIVVILFFIIYETTDFLSFNDITVYHVVKTTCKSLRLLVPITECLMFYFFSLEIEFRFNELQKCLSEILSNDSKNWNLLENIRILHFRLSGCVQKLNFAFSMPISVILFFLVLNCLVAVYFFTIAIENRFNPLRILESLVNLIAIIFVCHRAEKLENLTEEGVKIFFIKDLTFMNKSCQFQMDYLCHQINLNRYNISCLGLFKFNMSFLGTFSTITVTYVIALLQLLPEIEIMMEDFQ